MAIDAKLIQQNLLSSLQHITPAEDINRGLMASQQREQGAIQNQLLQQRFDQGQAQAPLEQQALQQGVDLKSIQIQKEQALFDALGVPDMPTAKQVAFNVAKLSAIPTLEGKLNQIRVMKENAVNQGRTTHNLDELEKAYAISEELGDIELNSGIQAFRETGLLDAPGGALTAGEQEFESSIKDFSEKDKVKARRIKTGLDPRAIGSAIQTITDEGIAEKIGDTEAIIAERKKFGELTGASRSKAIDKGFESIEKIDKNITNIDRAIAEIDAGASTGVIESRFFPSFKAATIKLEQIQRELGLDIIGSVSFGALSEGELELALKTALPTGLKPDKLKEFLVAKKAAQAQLRSYYAAKMNFLEDGGSIAGFLRQQERTSTQQPATEQPAPSNIGRFKVEVLQ